MCTKLYSEEIFDLFIDVSKKYWTAQTYINLLSLNKTWYDKLINEPVVQSVETFKSNIKKIINFDPEVYDQFTYQRLILKRLYVELLPLYQKLKLNVIDKTYTEDDLEDDLDTTFYLVYCMVEKDFPIEVTLFIEMYSNYPEPKINLLQPEYINRFLLFNRKELNSLNLYLSTKPKYDNILFLIPVCYTKHYKQNYRDINYVTVLCTINIIDDHIESELKNKNNRYLILHVSLNNLDNNAFILAEIEHYIHKIYKSIRTNESKDKIKEFYYFQDILNIAKSFKDCLQCLMKDHRSHL
jgi:hypothetical protein